MLNLDDLIQSEDSSVSSISSQTSNNKDESADNKRSSVTYLQDLFQGGATAQPDPIERNTDVVTMEGDRSIMKDTDDKNSTYSSVSIDDNLKEERDSDESDEDGCYNKLCIKLYGCCPGPCLILLLPFVCCMR